MRRGFAHFITILFVLMGNLFSCDTASTVEPIFKDYFIRYYGGDGNQVAADMIVNDDGTIIIIGTSTDNDGLGLLIIKVDAQGNELWNKRIPSADPERAVDIERIVAGANAGKYAVLSNVFASDTIFIRLSVLDDDGTISQPFPNVKYLSNQIGYSVTPLQNGGFYIAGSTTDIDPEQAIATQTKPDIEDLLLIKLGVNGDPNSTNGVERVGNSSTGAAVKIFEVNTNLYHYCGYSDEFIGGESGEQNMEENFLFRRFISDPKNQPTVYSGSPVLAERMVSAVQNPDGNNYMMVGTQTDLNNSPGSRRLYATIMRENFTEVLRFGTLSGAVEEAVSAAPASGGDFLVVSNTVDAASGNRNITLRKVKQDFFPLITISFGAPLNDDRGSAAAELPNGDIVVLGTMNLTNQDKMALIKITSDGKFEK
jgi:hypothetical protein